MAVEKVHYLGLLKSVLGYVDTKNYTYGQLFNETNARTGGIQCSRSTLEDNGQNFLFWEAAEY